MQLVSLESMVFWKESHEKGGRSKKYWKTCMRITCITKRCTGSLHIEWASCVAATPLNLYVRAQEWIDHIQARLLYLLPRIKFWKSLVGITITPETYVCHANFDNKYKEQLTITVIFAFEGFMQYLYLSSLRLLFSISRARSPVSKVVWVNLDF